MPPLPSSSSAPPLGKRELLAWAAETSGVRPCDKYADLRDGAVLLALAHHVLSSAAESRSLRHGPNGAAMNWDALRKIMEWHRLPLHLCDRRAVAAGHARYCFNMLVLFYFLDKLARDSDFCVDFANPIDAGIAAFLQSPQSLLCIGKIPAVAVETTTSEKEEKKTETVQDTHAAAPTSTTTTTTSSGSGGGGYFTGNTVMPHPTTGLMASLPSNGDDGGERTVKNVDSEGKREVNIMPKLHSLQASNARLESELDHVRATSQLMLAQQRGLLTSEVTRVREQFEVQMALLRLERDHELQQCLVEMHEEYACFLDEVGAVTFSPSPHSSNSASDSRTKSAELLALEGKMRIMERELSEARGTVQQLRSALIEQRDRHDAFAQKIHAICSAGPSPGAPEDSVLLNTLTSSLETQPQALRDVVSLRLKTLLSEVAGLQYEVERLRGRKGGDKSGDDAQGNADRLQMQLERLKQTNKFLRYRSQYCCPPPQQQLKDWYAVPLADGLEAPSCTVDSHTCDAICAQVTAAIEAQTPTDSPLRRELRRLVGVVQVLQFRVQTSSAALIAYRDKQQNLYEQMLCARQDAELGAQERQREMDAKLDEQRLRAEANEAALSSKLRFVEERSSRRESMAQMLHERVRDMISSLPNQSGNVSGLTLSGGLQEALQQIMVDVSNSLRTRDSLEAALSELSEEVATLRQELSRRRQEAERMQAALAAATTSQKAARTELGKARAEVNTLRDAMTVEVDTLHRFVERVAELLLTEGPPPFLRTSCLPKRPLPSDATTETAVTASVTPTAASNPAVVHLVASDRSSSNDDGDLERRTDSTTLVGSAGMLLLSPEELERRKMAILSKYGFSNRIEN